MAKKLTTKLEFQFDEQEDFPVFDVEVTLPKTSEKQNHIITIKKKKKIIDASTKLF